MPKIVGAAVPDSPSFHIIPGLVTLYILNTENDTKEYKK